MNTKVMLNELGVIQFSNTIRNENSFFPKINVTYRLKDFLTDDNNAIIVNNINASKVEVLLYFDREKFITARDHLMRCCDGKGTSFKAYIIINEIYRDGTKVKSNQTVLGNIRHIDTIDDNVEENKYAWCRLVLTKSKHRRYFELLEVSPKVFDRI